MTIKSHLISGALLLTLVGNTLAGSNLSSSPISVHQPQTAIQQQLQTDASYRRGYTAYRTTRYKQRRNSKTKTILRIAAPAAIGAGIGALAGGKKGAGVGALLGGGGGALYHLYKSRNR